MCVGFCLDVNHRIDVKRFYWRRFRKCTSVFVLTSTTDQTYILYAWRTVVRLDVGPNFVVISVLGMLATPFFASEHDWKLKDVRLFHVMLSRKTHFRGLWRSNLVNFHSCDLASGPKWSKWCPSACYTVSCLFGWWQVCVFGRNVCFLGLTPTKARQKTHM